MKAPSLKVRALAYYTEFQDRVSSTSFYHDDLRSFVNFSLSGIDTSLYIKNNILIAHCKIFANLIYVYKNRT